MRMVDGAMVLGGPPCSLQVFMQLDGKKLRRTASLG